MTKCALQGCNKKAKKKFCCNKHKDRYHNLNNPRGKFAHFSENLSPLQDADKLYGYGHPFASGDEGHGQE